MSYFPNIFTNEIVDTAGESSLTLKNVVKQLNALLSSASNAATSGDVTIPLTTVYDGYTTNDTADIDASLADGFNGQVKIIKLETKDTNDLVLTPANFADGATITFDASGEVAVLVFIDDSWQSIYTDATVNSS